MSALANAFRLVEKGVAETLPDFDRMLAIDTSFPPGEGYPAFAALMEELLTPLGFAYERVTVPRTLWWRKRGQASGERVNLIARRRSGRPACCLYYHVDTVPPGPGWTKPPFQLTREGDRLFGRGASDMKGTIVATLLALRAAQRCGLVLAYDPMLLLCTDEEGGLYPGIRYLAEQGMIEGHLLSFNGGAAPRIWAGCFGSFDLLIRIHGRSAHSGDPAGGINAIEASIPLIEALSRERARLSSITSALPPPPHRNGAPLTALLTVAAAHGGQKGSAIPGLFEVLVNRRYAPEESFEAVLGELTAIVNATVSGSCRAETEVIGHLPPVLDPTGPHWPRWQAALSRGFGFAPDSFRAWGASSSSDMGWVQQAGIREILLGGLSRPDNNGHAADEHTTVSDVVALARSILAYLAAEFAADFLHAERTP